MNAKKQMSAPGKETGLRSPGRRNGRNQPNSRIEGCLGELAGLKKPGETYDHLLVGMIEREKKHGYLKIWIRSRREAGLWR